MSIFFCCKKTGTTGFSPNAHGGGVRVEKETVVPASPARAAGTCRHDDLERAPAMAFPMGGEVGDIGGLGGWRGRQVDGLPADASPFAARRIKAKTLQLSLIHISEPTRPY